MRRWIALAAKLYPRPWRERYGEEFDALMEDVEPDGRELVNVLGGALRMQLRSETTYFKLAGVMAVVGAIALVGVSFRLPYRYVSSSTLRFTPPAQDPDDEATQQLDSLAQEVLSRYSLAELILRPSLNLYRGERQRVPMEDVIEQMRRDIQIRRKPGAFGAPTTVDVSFTYPDAFLAHTVAGELTTRLTSAYQTVNRNREAIWRRAWQEDPPQSGTLETIVVPTDPRKAGGPNRFAFAAAGLVLGVLIASVLCRPRPVFRLAAFAVAGCALAAALSYLVPSRYTSTAAMRMTPAMDPKRWYGDRAHESPAEHVQRMTREILSDSKFGGMRDRVRIEMQPPSGFLISVTDNDPVQAQTAVRTLVTGYTERNIVEERERMKTAGPDYRLMAEHKMGEMLEVLDPATLPVLPVYPNRLTIALLGLGGGLLVGLASRRKLAPSALRQAGGLSY